MKPGQSDYLDVLDPGRKRRVLLYRALGACALAAVLMLAVTFFDGRDDSAGSQTDSMTPPVLTPFQLASVDPSEDRPGQQPEGDEGASLPEDEAPEPDDQGAAADTVEVEIAEPPPEASSETAVVAVVEPAQTAPAPAPASTPTPGAGEQARPRVSPSPRPPAASPAPAQAGASHLIQVGDFGDAGSRSALRDAVRQDGHPATLQWRVAVGPFPDRAAADAAQRRLERDRKLKGLVVRLGGTQFFVQMGVFADGANAEALQGRLQAWGFKVQRDARLMVGPFPDRLQAEAVAGGIMLKNGETTQIITAPGR